jgi:hypothetical protein
MHYGAETEMKKIVYTALVTGLAILAAALIVAAYSG